MGWLSTAKGWLEGRKTVLGGCVLIAAGVAGAAFGQLPVDQAVLAVGLGVSISGWAAKADRHQREILEALEGVAQAGAKWRAGDRHEAAHEMAEVLASQATACAEGGDSEHA